MKRETSARLASIQNKIAVGIGAIGLVGTASAASGDVDVTTVIAAIVAAGAAIALVGSSKLTMQVGGRVWAWIGRML